MLEPFGYLMAVLIGLCLGLMGSGGSILTVPVLVYVFRLNPILGTVYSMFIVGLTSLAGLAAYARGGRIRLGTAALFALPSLSMVYLVRAHLIHELPERLSLPGLGLEASRDALIMGLFALVLAAAGFSMLRKRPLPAGGPVDSGERSVLRRAEVALVGLLVGALTGLVGAGGGFLIVPALVLLNRLPMEAAVGTSLTIITAQSFVGFATDWKILGGLDWTFLAGFSALSIGGAVLGGLLAKRFNGERLRRPFAWFILLLSVGILAGEFLMKGNP